MKKYFLLMIILCFSKNLLAAEAIVIVLQAPLLKEAKFNSRVLQYIRKGEKVYVPNELISKDTKLPNFIPTFDRAGNVAYVSSYFIKVITNDELENQTPISYGEHDPTDYRIEEPIPSTYPFSNISYLKASFSFTMGNNIKSPYEYNKTFGQQDFTTEKGGRFLITKRVEFDKYDRFYFGALLILSSTHNYIIFSDTTNSTENRSILRFGPMLSFDAFSGRDWRITFGSGFTYNYHKTSIQFTGLNQSGEERFFTGFSLSPVLSAYVQIENIFPAFDIIAGTDFNFYQNRTLSATDVAAVPELWPNDSIKEEMKPQATLFIGAQFKY